jgi:hypothetical protein
MSEEQDKARLLAERIAQRISQGESVTTSSNASLSTNDVSALRSTLEEFNRRLVQIERQLANKNTGATQGAYSPFPNQAVLKNHPSMDKFEVDEATAISELVDFFEGEKKCTLDPSGKPCDHCSMCSSRGF